jgi:hypothetical protein
MKKIITFLFFVNCIFYAIGQTKTFDNTSNDIVDYTITNSQKVITNDMIFMPPYDFEKNKAPLFLVNGNKVDCITYFIKSEIKKILVLQPNEAKAKYKTQGRNGVILVTLKAEVKEPKIVILTNKMYYKCINENNIKDTTKSFYDKVKGENCKTLDLTDTASIQTLYINFENNIIIKNLGAGWDKTYLTLSGGSLSGSGDGRIIRVTKKGIVILTIGREHSKGVDKKTVIKMRVVDLPKWE